MFYRNFLKSDKDRKTFIRKCTYLINKNINASVRENRKQIILYLMDYFMMNLGHLITMKEFCKKILSKLDEFVENDSITPREVSKYKYALLKCLSTSLYYVRRRRG